MTDTILTAVAEVPSPWTFQVDSNTEIAFSVKKYDPAKEDWVSLDIASSRWDVFLRAYKSPEDAAILVNEPLTKSVVPSWVEHPFYPGNTPQDGLYWLAVLVDNDNAQAGTPTGKRERILFRFRQAIKDAPQVNP